MKTFDISMTLERKYSNKVDELKFSLSKCWEYRNHSKISKEIVVDLIKEIRETTIIRNSLKEFLYKNC